MPLKAIDDDNISCDFPKGIAVQQGVSKETGSNVSAEQDSFDFVLIYARYARLCGQIAKQLYSASALSRPFQEMLSRAAKLDDELRLWRESIPLSFRPGTPFRPSVLKDVPFIQVLVLNFGYNYATCAIYRRFSPIFLRYDSQSNLRDLRTVQSKSGTKCLEAARSMILLTKHLDIESHSPGWYVRNCFL